MEKSKSNLRITPIFLAIVVLITSCSSATLIRSEPGGADVFLDGERMGKTPYMHKDTKIVGSKTLVELRLEGYEPFHTSFARNEEADVGAIIGGIFLLFPFLWTMRYKDSRTYELVPDGQ